MASLTPPRLQALWPDVDWDTRKLQALELPNGVLPLSELAWILDHPIWSSRPPAPLFDLVPRDVMRDPTTHAGHARRIADADLSYPLHAMAYGRRYVVLDGLHRLARLVGQGAEEASVAFVAEEDLRAAGRSSRQPGGKSRSLPQATSPSDGPSGR